MRWVKLEECCTIQGGATPKRNVDSFWGEGLDWFTPKDLSSLNTKEIGRAPEQVTDEGLNSCSAKLIPANSLLLSSRAPIGHLAITTQDCCTNQGFQSLIPKQGAVDIEYLYFVMKWSVPRLQDMGRGATFKEISKAIVKGFEIPLPPLEEQKRIAGILDEADRVRKKTQALIDKYDELAQSLFLDMFGDPVTNPKGWEQFLLSEHCIVVTKGTTPTSLNEDFTSSGVPFLRAQNVVNGRVDLEDVLFVSQDTHDGILKRSQIHSGDILFTIAGSLGRTGIVPATNTGLNCNQAVAIIRPMKESMNPFFLNGLLSSEAFNRNLLSNKVTATISNLSLGQIKQAVVPIPPQSEQKRFEESIKFIEAERKRAEKQVRDCNSLFNALLQKAFKGELT